MSWKLSVSLHIKQILRQDLSLHSCVPRILKENYVKNWKLKNKREFEETNIWTYWFLSNYSLLSNQKEVHMCAFESYNINALCNNDLNT